MAVHTEVLNVPVPGLRALRMSTDELRTGMKEYYAIARYESGRAEWWTRGKVWQVGPGSLLIQQPGDIHRDLSRDGTNTFQIVSFPAAMVEDVTGKIRVHPQLELGDERGAPFQRLHDAIRFGADRLTVEVAVAEAIAAFGRIGDAGPDGPLPVRRAVELLQERYAESVTLDELADHGGLDKFHLCRAFRAQVGIPPHAYLTRLRIMRAKQLLAEGVRASEVAPRVGIYDQSQLNRHFRRLVGMTPGAYARHGSPAARSATP